MLLRFTKTAQWTCPIFRGRAPVGSQHYDAWPCRRIGHVPHRIRMGMSYIWCTATICVRFSCGTTGLDKAQQFAYTDSRLCVPPWTESIHPFPDGNGCVGRLWLHYHFPNKNQCLRSYQSNLSFMTTNRNTAMQSMQTLILVSLPCLSNSRSPLSKHHS